MTGHTPQKLPSYDAISCIIAVRRIVSLYTLDYNTIPTPLCQAEIYKNFLFFRAKRRFFLPVKCAATPLPAEGGCFTKIPPRNDPIRFRIYLTASGLALGVGFYEAAIAGTVAVFAVITLLQKMDNKLHRRSRQLEAYIELSNISLGDFLRTARAAGIDVSDVQREFGDEESQNVRAYIATLKGKKRRNHAELMEMVLAIDGVEFAEEL